MENKTINSVTGKPVNSIYYHVYRVLVDKTKERLIICPTGAQNSKEDDLNSVFRVENQNTMMKSVGSEVRLTVMQSQFTTC